MQQTVFVPIAAFLLASVAILANKPQNPGSTDWDSKLEADICMVDTLHARAMIKVHPDDWRERLDEMRRNASAMYEKCDKHLMSQGETEIRDFLEYGRQCNMNTQFTVVAIVFIVLFLLALTGMIGFAVLYFRFGK